MEQCLPSLESLHFGGGEPLIVPEMLEALDYCIQSGRADQIDVSYNTNITVIPERVARLWPHFRSVSVYCSIDGYGPLNDYIRRPSKWRDIDRNLHLLDNHYHEWKLKSLTCLATVQIYNVLQLGELFDYLASGFQNVAPAPHLTPLYFPHYLSIQILPARAKQVARDRLLERRAAAEARGLSSYHSMVSSIDTTIAFMDAAEDTRELREFLVFSEKSDREFGDSWRKAAPELARLLLDQSRAAV
jgi:hypothetical protein